MQFTTQAPLEGSREIHRRRVVVLASTVLLVAAVLSNVPARANPCGSQGDMLTHADPLMANVQPADCATVMQAAPAFSWPAQSGVHHYTVVLTFPDGHVETRESRANWLAWDRAVPAGTYSWTVEARGRVEQSSSPRRFTIDVAANLSRSSLVAARRTRPTAG